MKAKLVKFDDDGTKCKNDINYLRRHPECGIPFIQDKPFKPQNKPPPPDRSTTLPPMQVGIPPIQAQVEPTPTSFTRPITPADTPTLAQDYTNNYDIEGRRILGDTPAGLSFDEHIATRIHNAFNRSGYGLVDRIGNDSYPHQDPNPRILTDEQIIQKQIQQGTTKTRLSKPRRPLPEIPGEELVIVDPEVEEDVVIQQADRFIRRGRPQISLREAEQIADYFEKKNIKPERTFEILEKYKLFDREFEEGLKKIADPNERASLRKLRAMRIIARQNRERGIRPVGEIELEDFGAGVGLPNREPPPIRQTRIRPWVPSDPLPQEINITDLPTEILENILGQATEINVESARRSITELREEAIKLRELGVSESQAREMETAANRLEERVQQTERMKETILQGKSKTLKPRGMTDEELIDAQIQELTRNSTQEEAKKIEQSIRSSRAKTIDPVPESEITKMLTGKEEGIELVAINPREEQEFIISETLKEYLRTGTQNLNRDQVNEIIRKGSQRGIPRNRTLEILKQTGAYDEEVEVRVEEHQSRVLAREISGAVTRRDTNLVRREEREGLLRPQRPMDRTAGRLPENLRSLYKTTQRQTTQMAENIRTGTLELITRTPAIGTRMFGQRYTGVPRQEIELPDISIQRQITDQITQEAQVRLQETLEGLARPTLRRPTLQRFREGALGTSGRLGGAGGLGGVLAGFGVAELMQQAGATPEEIALGAGAAGGMIARLTTMAGTRALTRQAVIAATETATMATIRAGTSLLRGAAEGGLLGIALLPADIALNNDLLNHGFSHTAANLTSGGVIGGGTAALTTIGLAALGAAPETLGASLVVGAIALAATEIIGAITGQAEDAEQQRQQRRAIKQSEIATRDLNRTNAARLSLINSLKDHNYNFDEAVAAFSDKDSLGINNDTWSSFSRTGRSIFTERPNLQHSHAHQVQHHQEPVSGEQQHITELFNKYVMHEVVARVCRGGTNCQELLRHDQGELTDEEQRFLDSKTNGTWASVANLQVETSIQELDYKRQRIQRAQHEVVIAWNENQQLAKDLDPYVVATASLDPTFTQRYMLAVELDAQQRVIDAYNQDGTKIDDLPSNIRDAAGTNPHFMETINNYYNIQEQTRARQEYAEMIHGLNEQNQNRVDTFNTELMNELSSYGQHYDKIVADINNERLYQGRSDLLYFNVNEAYNQNKMEFTPMPETPATRRPRVVPREVRPSGVPREVEEQQTSEVVEEQQTSQRGRRITEEREPTATQPSVEQQRQENSQQGGGQAFMDFIGN